MMGVISYFNAKHIYRLYILQLVLNGSWSWIFFTQKAPDLACINIATLIAVNVLIIKKFWLERRFFSFIGYVPYLLWLLFASYLNIFISVLN
jgi:tryptophan-rich sensory protein